jgi:hypothetical protein
LKEDAASFFPTGGKGLIFSGLAEDDTGWSGWEFFDRLRMSGGGWIHAFAGMTVKERE